jgi:hypothetical protein
MSQQGTGYNYTQRGDVVLATRGGTTRNTPINYKPFRVFKGVDTTLTFFIRDSDGKSVALQNKNILAQLVKRNTNTSVLNKNLNIIDYVTGNASLVIRGTEIIGLDAGLYHLVLTYTDNNNTKTALYSDLNYRNEYVVEIENNILPEVIDDSIVEDFVISDNNVDLVSFPLAGTAQKDIPNGLNTVAIYGTNATGTVRAQATLEATPIESDWFDVNFSIAGAAQLSNFTGVDAYIFDGNFYWVRFVTNITTGTIDKIAYRN